MALLASSRAMTALEFEELPDAHRYEFINGEPVEREFSALSSAVGRRINHFIDQAVIAGNLGTTMQSDGGLQCFANVFPRDPDRVLFSDGCVFSNERLPTGLPASGWVTVAPEMVLEVVSANDKAVRLAQKTDWYFRAGVRSVWIAFPETRTIWVRHADRRDRTFGPGDTVEDPDVLPGFAVAIEDLFLPPAPEA